MPSPIDLPNGEHHPVLHALNGACAKNWEAFLDTISKLSAEARRPVEQRSFSEAEALRMMENAASHLKDVEKIGRFIVRRKVLPIEEASQKALSFRDLGDDWVEDIFSRLQKLPQGKPPTRRWSHIEAFEYMLQSKRNSMGKAVRKFCPCGKEHAPECHQRLKAGIHSLKRILRGYAPDLVAQYDALHPDRFEKPRHG